MNNTRHKKALSKWLFTVVLLLSFFTFSGVVVQTQTQEAAQQTTLVANQQIRFAKSIRYKRALGQTYDKHTSVSFFPASEFSISRLHSCLIKIRISRFSVGYMGKPNPAILLPVKTVPQNSGDEPVILLG